MRFENGEIVVDGTEVWQARLGFEAVGAKDLSDELYREVDFEWDSKETTVTEDAARLILAGNLALVGSLNTFGPMHPNADALRDDARKTVNSTIEAITVAETQLRIDSIGHSVA